MLAKPYGKGRPDDQKGIWQQKNSAFVVNVHSPWAKFYAIHFLSFPRRRESRKNLTDIACPLAGGFWSDLYGRRGNNTLKSVEANILSLLFAAERGVMGVSGSEEAVEPPSRSDLIVDAA